jgi:hypothetical protein
MYEYILPILGFVTGGGVTSIVSIWYTKRTSKLDYTEKLSTFWEDQNEKLLARFKALEERLEKVENNSCERAECPNRVKSVA